MIIGIDDTDSKKGMCTTYLCAFLMDILRDYGDVSTPRLVRLNPCIPYKTRGNGAIAFEISTDKCDKVKEAVKSCVYAFSELDEVDTNPGVVFIDDETTLSNADIHILKGYYEKAVREVLNKAAADTVISGLGLDSFGLKNKRGIIGALAAAAFVLLLGRYQHYDFTYELIAYRHKARWGTPRIIDENSVWTADAATYPLTWDTVDVANRRIVFAPHSPCPVLFGIRGDRVDAIYRAYELIHAEPVERVRLFITNQGTDFHLITPDRNVELSDYHSYIVEGVVESQPVTMVGGHVVFRMMLKDGATTIDCIAYEPTKGFRDIVRQLRVGDEVMVFGSFKQGTLNLEKIGLISLNREELRNPRCERCGRSMESAGRRGGYRCKRCGTHRATKEVVTIERTIEKGLYEVPPVARRHIAKPLIRMRHERVYRGLTIHPCR